MESFPEETLLPSAVTNLDIAYLDNLKSLEYKGLHHLTSLRELKIRFCPKLQSITEEGLPSSLSSLVIYHCPELESFPKAGLPLTLESLEIICCNKLISGRMHWNLQNLQHLLHFSIAGCENVESFPEERLLPSSLSSLKIWRLQNLKSINCKGLQHLTSLRKLEMLNCIKLQSMPEQELPPSISSLIIKNCPLLKRRRFHKPLTLDTTKREE
ncbi:hypothetical protein JCGZ_24559 [Jatropha curcas]|uniref:Uncharacterized protein n=1 Tax=Jatropha curcas TaxID=180498 RepID=A0A067L7S7_JATCU|nr:hypothetical protein JCGZ_24559 [Jatropha curcas]